LSLAAALASEAPKAVFSETSFHFGKVAQGTVVECDFVLKNQGSAPLRIEKVKLASPLLATSMPREIAPGAQGTIHFKLDTGNLVGAFQGRIVVFLNDPALSEADLSFEGQVIPAIELSPMPAFFVAGQRGRGGRAAIEIINHESQPLRLENVDHPKERFRTELETLEPGQRYRLTLTLKPDSPGGQASDTILIRTSSKRMPVLKVAANTYLYERVHTFPDVIDFSTLRLGDVSRAALTLMIYDEGSSDFKVKLSTDVPALSLKGDRGPKGDRYQATVTLNPENSHVGPIKGSIFIDTNDPGFPRVTVPVYGEIVEH
jgi:hypothetical protein